MKEINRIMIRRTWKYLFLALASCFLFTACDDDEEGNDTPQEQLLNVTSSTEYVELDEDKLNEVALTFTWTAARELGEDYLITYLTKFDTAENDFSAETTILEDEGTDVFTKSYTHKDLQNLLTIKWNKQLKEEVPLQFRVIGSVSGPRFVMPEVSTITVTIKTYGPIEAAGLQMAGSAVPNGATLAKTVENQYVYAYYGPLNAGDINFPINQDGVNVLSPDADTAIDDGNPMLVEVKPTAEASSWTIPSAGNYRVVINLERKTATIYSEANDIQPIKVKHTGASAEEEPITAMYLYGEPTGWGWKDEYAFIQSIADPNVWIFNASAVSGRSKFGVAKDNGCHVFSCAPIDDENGQDIDAKLESPMALSGSTSRGQRNSYFKIPSGVNFIVLDLTNKTVVFSVR